MDRRSVVTK